MFQTYAPVDFSYELRERSFPAWKTGIGRLGSLSLWAFEPPRRSGTWQKLAVRARLEQGWVEVDLLFCVRKSLGECNE